jgi:hypothetical protein
VTAQICTHKSAGRDADAARRIAELIFKQSESSWRGFTSDFT